MSDIVGLLFFVFLGITIHEFAHAWAADRLGDPTPRYMGRLTFNPMAHLDPLGTLMFLVSLVYGFGIGWGKPVPVNPRNIRKLPIVTGMGLIAFAGPFSNLLLASALALAFHFPLPLSFRGFLMAGVFANVGLALFNLLPLPPLDGFDVLMGIIGSFRTRTAYNLFRQLSQLEAHGPLILFALIAIDYILPVSILGSILGPPFRLITSLLLR
jgi:Zn-dependent protease